jgi:hypothetical protein
MNLKNKWYLHALELQLIMFDQASVNHKKSLK